MLTTGVVTVVAVGLVACGPVGAVPQTTPGQSAVPSSTATQPQTAPSDTPRPSQIPPPGAPDVDASTPDGPVEAAPLPTTSAALTEQIALDTGMVIEIVSVDSIEVTAETPGEVDGSAVRVTVAARNDSTETQSVDSAVVNVESGADIGIGTTAGDPAPLAGDVAPGATASGTYVFMLNNAADREITVSVNYAAGEPVAVFTGTTS